MEYHFENHLPFLATEPLLIDAVLKGKDRQETHALIKKISFEASPEDLLPKLAQALGIKEREMKDLLKMENLIGRSKEQVIEYLKLEVEPLLSHYLKDKITIPRIDV